MIDTRLLDAIVHTRHLPHSFVTNKLLNKLRPDGFAVFKEYMAGKNKQMHSVEVWSLLHEDDQAAVLSFRNAFEARKWKWILVPEDSDG